MPTLVFKKSVSRKGGTPEDHTVNVKQEETNWCNSECSACSYVTTAFVGATVHVDKWIQPTIQNEFKDPDNTVRHGGGVVNVDGRDVDTDPLGGVYTPSLVNHSTHAFAANDQRYYGYDRGFNPYSEHDGGWVKPGNLREYAPVINPQVVEGDYTAKHRNRYDVSLKLPSFVEGGSGGYYRVNGTDRGPIWPEPVWQYEFATIEAVPPSEWVCSGWSDTWAPYTNPRTVTPSNDFALSAIFKSHLGSDSYATLCTNQQRKISRWKHSVIFGLTGYTLIYESANRIWKTFSTNMGATWQPEQLLSTNPGTHSFPSLAVGAIDGGVPISNDIVWITNNNEIWISLGGGAPSQVATINQHASVPSAPVVANRGLSAQFPNLVACTGAGGIEVFKYNGQSWSRDTYSDMLRNRFRPCLAYGGIYSQNPAYLTYDDGQQIYWDYFMRYDASPSRDSWRRMWPPGVPPEAEKTVPGSVSGGSGTKIGAQAVAIPTGSQRKFAVVWQSIESLVQKDEPKEEVMIGEEDNQGIVPIDPTEFAVCFQKYDEWGSPNQWGAMQKFVGLYYATPTIALLPRSQFPASRLIWGWTDGQRIFSTESTNEGVSWNKPIAVYSGDSPQTVIGAESDNQSIKYAYRDPTGPIYRIEIAPSQPVEDQGDKSREIAVADDSTGSSVTIEMLPLAVESYQNVGTEELVPFAIPEDSAFVPTANNLEEYLGTSRFIVPQSADRLRFKIRMKSTSASMLTNGGNALRVIVQYTVNDSTTRILARWRFTGGHWLNKSVRLPARLLRGKALRLSVALAGLNKSNTRLQVSASSVFRSAPGQHSLTKPPSQEIPAAYMLNPNFPNTFNPSTEIRFDLPEPGTVSLAVYDVLGREIAQLASGDHEAGYHRATWNASNQASGVYFARFIVMNAQGSVTYSKVNKLVLVK